MLPESLILQLRDVFPKMYALRPEAPCKVLVGPNKRVEVTERAHKSYLKTPPYDAANPKSYMFAGLEDQAKVNDDLPEVFQPILDWLNQDAVMPFNQVVVNWYKDGTEYIPMHSDCETGMVPGASIVVVNLEEPNTSFPRLFTLESRSGTQPKLELRLKHGMVIRMLGDTQKEYRHGVCKDGTMHKRMSMIMRSYL